MPISTLVASAEARMLTRLLPSSTAPITCSICGAQAIDEGRAAISLALQRMHARARGGGQRGLGAGEEGRQEQQQRG